MVRCADTVWSDNVEYEMADWNRYLDPKGFRIYADPIDSIVGRNGRSEVAWLSPATAATRYGPVSSTTLAVA